MDIGLKVGLNSSYPPAHYGNDEYTVLLLHCDGIQGATVFTDVSRGGTTHIITTHGNAHVDTTDKKFGTGALLCDGLDDYLSIPNSDDFNPQLGDISIDLQIKTDSPQRDQVIGQYGGANNGWYLQTNAWVSGKIGMFIGDGTNYKYRSSLATVTDNNWHHIAATWNATTKEISFFVDGVEGNGAEISSGVVGNVTTIEPTLIGTDYFGAYDYTRRLDEIRVSKGIIRWSSNFPPPIGPYY